jgi:type IX secretion system PorP/SprF family membrane protein
MTAFTARSQDAVFSQFMFNKLYLNPAFAGSSLATEYQLNSRQQWINVPGPYTFTGAYTFNQAAFQTYFPKQGVGMAVQLRNSIEGEGILESNNATFYLSAGKSILDDAGINSKIQINFGMSFGVGQKSLNWDRLKFSSQYHPYQGYFRDVSNVNPQNNISKIILDPSFGIRGKATFRNGNKEANLLTFGYSIFHIARPVETFFDIENELPRRHSLFMFYYINNSIFKEFSNKKNMSSIGIIFDYQLPISTSTLIVGQRITKDFYITTGIRHRNFIELNKRSDACLISFNSKFDNTQVGLSYDFTLSHLSILRTQGTFELSFVQNFAIKNKGKRKFECVSDFLSKRFDDEFVIFMP